MKEIFLQILLIHTHSCHTFRVPLRAQPQASVRWGFPRFLLQDMFLRRSFTRIHPIVLRTAATRTATAFRSLSTPAVGQESQRHSEEFGVQVPKRVDRPGEDLETMRARLQ